MSLTFIHTADWQLGKPFASVRDDAKRHRLQQERLEAVRRIQGIVAGADAAFVVVAGDLFDSSRATKATVSAACGAIGALGVPVLVIPGNHDHAGAGTIWEQEFFRREADQLAPNLRVLLAPEPLALDDAVVLPAPLLRRQDAGDPTAWIRSAEVPSELPRIVLAHGTVQGFGGGQPDDEDVVAATNLIDLARLETEGIDYVALGDWHGTKQVGSKSWYSGTHEIDRFPRGEGYDPGNVLVVTVGRGVVPVVNKVATGRLGWTDLAFRFSGDESLGQFTALLDGTAGDRADERLVLLTLEGSLGIEAAGRLEKILDSWEARLLRLKLANRVSIAPSGEEIAELTRRATAPLIADVAARLVARVEEGGDAEDAETARIALRELHAACLP